MKTLSKISLRSRPTAMGWLLSVSAIVLLIVGYLTALKAVLAAALFLAGALGFALATTIWLRRALRRANIKVIRRSTPAKPSWGTPTVITVIATGTRLPLALIWRTQAIVKDQVHPNVASFEGTVELELSQAGWQASYRVVPLARGHWPLGPLHFQFVDLLGLIRTTINHHYESPLIVWPQIADIDDSIRAVSGNSSDRMMERATGNLLPDSDDSLLREYVPGDDIRRVHWASSARRKVVMVKSEESMPMMPMALVLDAHLIPTTDISVTVRKPGPQAVDDPGVIAAHWPVDLAATISLALQRRNTRLQSFISAPGQWSYPIAADDFVPLLTEVPDLASQADAGFLVDMAARITDGVLVALIAPLPGEYCETFARTALHRRAGASRVVVISATADDPAAAQCAAILESYGWHVTRAAMLRDEVHTVASRVVGS